MKNIETREDIEFLVNSFYTKIPQNPIIGFFFTDIAKVNWDTHLPKMYNFWQSLLLADIKFDGNPMGAHFPINEIVAMEPQHFEEWLRVWTETVNENFIGKLAEDAKTKAKNIAKLMSYKMEIARRL